MKTKTTESRQDKWDRLWGTYIAKLERIEELKAAGRYGYQMRMPWKSVGIARQALQSEFPEESKNLFR